MRILTFLLAGSLALAAFSGGAGVAKSSPPLQVEIRNIDLHVTEDVTVKIRNLRGRFLPVREGDIPFFDDPNSYVVDVEAGEVVMDEASLNALVNGHAFGHGKPPIRDLELKLEDGLLRQKGVLDKKIDLPFKTKGAVEPTPDGKIRVHAKSIKSLGLPVKPLMKLLGIEMDDLLKLEPGHGLTVDDNDLIIDPQLMLPPPRMRGRITAVRIEGGQLIQTFGDVPFRPLQPPASSKNHFYWRGDALRFGRLTMKNVDLELIDQDASDVFDFSVAGYNRMLVAGYSKTLPNGSLKTYLPDFADLQAGGPVAHTPAQAGRASRD
jgi:hypothetical protein